jgi:uncharacterized protein YdaU (DUF1376 family)
VSKSPAVQLYVKDAYSDTMHLTPYEFTAYWRLIFAAWLGIAGMPQGHLPDDDGKLQRMTGLSRGQWKRARQSVRDLFKTDDEHGSIYQKRLVEELEKQRRLSELRSRAGKASAATKAQQTANKPPTNRTARRPTEFNSSSASASATAVTEKMKSAREPGSALDDDYLDDIFVPMGDGSTQLVEGSKFRYYRARYPEMTGLEIDRRLKEALEYLEDHPERRPRTSASRWLADRFRLWAKWHRQDVRDRFGAKGDRAPTAKGDEGYLGPVEPIPTPKEVVEWGKREAARLDKEREMGSTMAKEG